MLTPVQASGDFEALLHRADGEAKPRLVSLKGITQRRNSSLRSAADSAAEGAGASVPKPAGQDHEEGLIDRQSRALQHALPASEEAGSTGQADPDLQIRPESADSSSAGSFATANELLTQRSVASTEWDEPLDDRSVSSLRPDFTRVSAYSQRSDSHESPSPKHAAADLEPVPSIAEEATPLVSSPQVQQQSPGACVEGNAALKGPVHRDPEEHSTDNPQTQGNDALHSLSRHDVPAPAQHISADQQQAEPLCLSDGNRSDVSPGCAADEASAAPIVSTSDTDQPHEHPQDNGSPPPEKAVQAAVPAADGLTHPADRHLDMGHATSLSDEAVSTTHASPITSPAASASELSEAAAVPAFESQAASSAGAQTSDSSQVCSPGQQTARAAQHSRSSSEVVGPGGELDAHSVAEHSELESYAGSEGVPHALHVLFFRRPVRRALSIYNMAAAWLRSISDLLDTLTQISLCLTCCLVQIELMC